MATYTPTGLAVAGANYTQKAGQSASARVASTLDAATFIETGTATSACVASGADAVSWTESGKGEAGNVAVVAQTKAGTATSAFSASSTDAKTSVETGSGVAPLTAGGLKSGKTVATAGIAIAGESFAYVKRGTAVLSGVASGASVSAKTFSKTGQGVLDGVASGSKVASAGKTGGNMQPPYGSFVYGDEDYGEDTYGGFRNDARRIASGTKVVTSPPTIFTGEAISTFTASATEATIYIETGTATSERTATGTDATVSGETGGNMEPPYGSVTYGDGAYGDGYYGGFRNDGQRIGSGFANKELGRAGVGILNLSGSGYFIPPTVPGDVEISELDDILLEIENLFGTPTSGDDVVLTVTES